MKVILLDFRGTLTTLPRPLEYLARLRAKEPGCKLILWSGLPEDFLEPELLMAVDDFWMKPGLRNLLEATGWAFTEVIVVDDDIFIRKVASRMLRSLPCPITVLTQYDLNSLVEDSEQGSSG